MNNLKYIAIAALVVIVLIGIAIICCCKIKLSGTKRKRKLILKKIKDNESKNNLVKSSKYNQESVMIGNTTNNVDNSDSNDIDMYINNQVTTHSLYGSFQQKHIQFVIVSPRTGLGFPLFSSPTSEKRSRNGCVFVG